MVSSRRETVMDMKAVNRKFMRCLGLCVWLFQSVVATEKIVHQTIEDFAQGNWAGVQMSQFGGLRVGKADRKSVV